MLFLQYCLGDQSDKNEMGGACSTTGGRGVHKVLVGKPEEKNHLEDPGVDGGIILGRIFSKWDVGAWTDLAQGHVAGTCECGNEHSGSIKCGGFLDQMRAG